MILVRDANLSLAPAELVAQRIRKAALAQAYQVHRVIGPPAAHFVSKMQLEPRLAIDSEQALGWNALTRITK